MGEYYYLVAGLPEPVLEGKKALPSFREVADEALEIVSEDDAELIFLVRAPFDHANIMNVLEQRGLPFDVRGTFSEEELRAELKQPDLLPDYIQVFLTAYEEKRVLFQGMSWEDQLNMLFYEQMLTHENDFIREYYTFEMDLRNLLAAQNARELKELLAESGDERKDVSAFVVGGNEISERIVKSNAPDFSVPAILPWSKKLFEFSKDNLEAFEKNVDELRFHMLDELYALSGFGIETVLGTLLQLAIVERWKKLELDTGKAQLDGYVTRIKSEYQMPKEF